LFAGGGVDFFGWVLGHERYSFRILSGSARRAEARPQFMQVR
jgi:hypothetical protein